MSTILMWSEMARRRVYSPLASRGSSRSERARAEARHHCPPSCTSEADVWPQSARQVTIEPHLTSPRLATPQASHKARRGGGSNQRGKASQASVSLASRPTHFISPRLASWPSLHVVMLLKKALYGLEQAPGLQYLQSCLKLLAYYRQYADFPKHKMFNTVLLVSSQLYDFRHCCIAHYSQNYALHLRQIFNLYKSASVKI